MKEILKKSSDVTVRYRLKLRSFSSSIFKDTSKYDSPLRNAEEVMDGKPL